MHLQEIAIAQLTAVYVNSQKTKPPYSTTKEFCHFWPKDEHYSFAVCQTIISLIEDNLFPDWAASYLPVDQLGYRDRGFSVHKPRVLANAWIYVLCPVITEENWLNAPLVFIDDKKAQFSKVYDLDSDRLYTIKLPSSTNLINRDVQWELIDESIPLE
ncbi:MAG: hypothetical protein ACO23V_12085 [Chitinophagaceae bacterium]